MSRTPGQPVFWEQLPDGSILFNFDGHIHAEGLDLTAVQSDHSTYPAPTPQNITWSTDETVPSPVGTIYAEAIRQVGPVSSQNNLFVVARDPLPQANNTNSPSSSIVARRDNQPLAQAAVSAVAKAQGNTAATRASASAGAFSVDIITGDGSSSFQKVPLGIADTGWQPFPASGGWGPFTPDPSWTNPEYRVDSAGFLHLRGLLYRIVGTGGWAAGAVIGTLPANARPRKRCMANQYWSNGQMRLDISATTGDIQAMIAGASDGLWISLDNITYDTNG